MTILKKIKKPLYKILLVEKIYESLARKNRENKR